MMHQREHADLPFGQSRVLIKEQRQKRIEDSEAREEEEETSGDESVHTSGHRLDIDIPLSRTDKACGTESQLECRKGGSPRWWRDTRRGLVSPFQRHVVSVFVGQSKN